MNDRFRLEIDGDDSTGDGTPGLLSRTGSFLGGGDYTVELYVRRLLTFTVFCPVDLIVTDSEGRTISKASQPAEIGAVYEELDLDGDGDLDDRITIAYPAPGEHRVTVVPTAAQPGDTFTFTLVVEDGTTTQVLAQGPVPEAATEVGQVTVDRDPPTLSVSADPVVLLPPEDWVPVQVHVQVQDDADPSPLVALVDIAPSWETDPAAVIYGAEYGTADDSLLLKAERGAEERWYRLTYAASDAAGNITYATTTVYVGNHQPAADAGPDQTANEGQAVLFDGTASADDDGDALSYFWDFGDGSTDTGPSPSHSYADDGTYTVTLTVDDQYFGGRHSDTLTVTVNNVAPTVAPISGPGSGVRGQTLSFSGSFTDLGTADTHTTSWQVLLGTSVVASGSGTDFSFTPTTSGQYQVTFSVTDDGGGVGTASKPVSVQAMEVQPEADDPTKVALVIGGTAGGDIITITPAILAGRYWVWINSILPQVCAPPEGTSFDRIVVYGQAGGDIIAAVGVSISAWLYGDAGNDLLKGGSGDDILLGGEGNDILVGGLGRNVLIGGNGSDLLWGGLGDEILIAGRTALDAPTAANDAALRAVMREWTCGDSYEVRVVRLQNVLRTGQNGQPATVFDDDAHETCSSVCVAGIGSLPISAEMVCGI